MSHIYVTNSGKGFKVNVILSHDIGHTVTLLVGNKLFTKTCSVYIVNTPVKGKLFSVDDVIKPYRPKVIKWRDSRKRLPMD